MRHMHVSVCCHMCVRSLAPPRASLLRSRARAHLCALMYLPGFGISKGQPDRLVSGYDFNGRVCGVGDMKDKPSVYYPYPFPKDMTSGSMDGADFTWAVCVEDCPRVDTFDAQNPPNMCMQSFKLKVTDSTIKAMGAKEEVTCGGLTGGMTDMKQFGTAGFLGYYKTCMKRTPLCACDGFKQTCTNDTCSSACCTGTAPVGNTTISSGAQQSSSRDVASTPVGQQVGNLVEMINATRYPEKTQFGIPMGHQYGFCFVPYPSYLPGKGSESSWTRCMPTFGSSAADAFNSSVRGIASNVNATASADSNSMESAAKAVVSAMSGPRETVMGLVEQVRKYKWVIAGCAGIALVISLLYTFLLKIAAGPLIYSMMLAVWVLLTGSLALLCVKAGYIDPSSVPMSGDIAGQMPAGVTFGPAETNRNMVVAGAVIIGVLWVLYTFAACVMIPRISVALKVMNIASSCVASMPSVIFLPTISWVFTVIIYTYFVIVLWYLASAGTWDADAHQYVWDQDLQRLMLIHFFGVLWGHAFILAMGNIVIAGAAADWFLADDKKDLGHMPVWASMQRSCKYHTGTAAFGSFIIAVVQAIRWAFRYYMYQLNKMSPDNPLIKLMSCIGECCLDCLERFLDFMNKNAYIQTAINATSFIPSAVAAVQLLLRNCLRVGTLNIITSAFIFLGKYFIALVTGCLGALWIAALENQGDLSAGMQNVSSAPVFPVIVIICLAFGIACAFLDVWGALSETKDVSEKAM